MDKGPKIKLIQSYKDIDGRKKALESKESRRLVEKLPKGIKDKFIRCFLDPDCGDLQDVTEYFVNNSEVTYITKYNPGSAAIFEYLYNRKAPLDIDGYFMKCKGGIATYKRLIALEEKLPSIIKDLYKGRRLLIDNIGSGPGRDMIGVLKRNPELADIIHIRNIDIDKKALDLGEKIAQELDISDSFSFIDKPFNEIEPRDTDIILLIGILCPLKLRVCRKILKSLLSYTRKGGRVIGAMSDTLLG